jgi:hypothetical protein
MIKQNETTLGSFSGFQEIAKEFQKIQDGIEKSQSWLSTLVQEKNNASILASGQDYLLFMDSLLIRLNIFSQEITQAITDSLFQIGTQFFATNDPNSYLKMQAELSETITLILDVCVYAHQGSKKFKSYFSLGSQKYFEKKEQSLSNFYEKIGAYEKFLTSMSIPLNIHHKIIRSGNPDLSLYLEKNQKISKLFSQLYTNQIDREIKVSELLSSLFNKIPDVLNAMDLSTIAQSFKSLTNADDAEITLKMILNTGKSYKEECYSLLGDLQRASQYYLSLYNDFTSLKVGIEDIEDFYSDLPNALPSFSVDTQALVEDETLKNSEAETSDTEAEPKLPVQDSSVTISQNFAAHSDPEASETEPQLSQQSSNTRSFSFEETLATYSDPETSDTDVDLPKNILSNKCCSAFFLEIVNYLNDEHDYNLQLIEDEIKLLHSQIDDLTILMNQVTDTLAQVTERNSQAEKPKSPLKKRKLGVDDETEATTSPKKPCATRTSPVIFWKQDATRLNLDPSLAPSLEGIKKSLF